MKLPSVRLPEATVAVLLTAICLALPTRNPTGDAWYYAACARWGHELAQPHHLLYNGVGWLWLRLLGAGGPAPAGLAALPWLQALNSLAYGGCLLALGPLLRRAGARLATVPAWLLLVGSTFGMLRFAVENEAYIQPLLLALLASLAWARGIGAAGCRSFIAGPTVPVGAGASLSQRPATSSFLLAGLLAACACLLHQMLVWWWLGLLLGLPPWRGRAALGAALAYAVPALLVPLAYWLAAPAGGGPQGVLRFALHDYLTGGARAELSLRTLLLTPISLVRTLAQAHGSLLPLLRRWPLPLGAVALGCLALAGWAVFFEKKSQPTLAPGRYPTATLPGEAAARRLRRTHLLIGATQLVFAALSAGNAEFMAMLPALAAVGLAGGRLRCWPAGRVAALGVALLGWNVAFGLLPAHTLTYTAAGPALRARVLRQPQAWFLLSDPNLLLNQLHYYTSQAVAPPRILGLPGQSAARFRPWLRQRLAAGDTIYTDALGSPQLLDRARLTLGNPAARLLEGFAARRVARFATFFGPVYLSRLVLPAGASAAPAAPSTRASDTVNTGAAR